MTSETEHVQFAPRRQRIERVLDFAAVGMMLNNDKGVLDASGIVLPKPTRRQAEQLRARMRQRFRSWTGRNL